MKIKILTKEQADAIFGSEFMKMINPPEMYDFGRSYERGRNNIQLDNDFTDWEQSLIDDALRNFKGHDFSQWKIERGTDPRTYGACYHMEKKVTIRELRGFREVDHFEFTVAHELRHVMQHETGKLVVADDCSSLTWTPDDQVFMAKDLPRGGDDYFNLPWERDANGYAYSCVDVRIYDQTLYKARETAKILF